MRHPLHIPYETKRLDQASARERLEEEYKLLSQRRSVRLFSSDPVPKELIELAVRIAGTAPSGAHRQPWHFVAISDPKIKFEIREKVEHEERDFYERRAPKEWLEALAPLGTDFVKTHLTVAPWLIVVFRQDYELKPDGTRSKNYYMTESVGIAVGLLIQALHRVGLATLTHTPAPMTFLRDICGRPQNEKPFVLMPVGYPAVDCSVPDLRRKDIGEILTYNL